MFEIRLRVPLVIACLALVGATKPDGGDLLPAKSRWTGTEDADASHSKSRPRPARLHVTARDEKSKTFEADFWIGKGDGLKLKGTVAADGAIDCVPTGILKGEWQREILVDHWHGTATADAVTLTRKLSANGGEKTMKLAPAKGKDD